MAFIEYGEEIRELTPGETVVGSGSQVSWRVQGADLAARHFALVGEAGATQLRSLSSQHLVAVNGRPVTGTVALADGDVISAGSARMLFLARADGARPPGWADAPAQEAWLLDARERRAYPLERRAVTIGRDATSNVHLGDPSVSRFHADVRREAGLFVLYSTGSAGTKVNGQRVGGPVPLEEGDQVEIGEASLRFTRQAPAGMEIVRGGDADESVLTRRATVTARQFEADDEPAEERRGSRPLIVGVALAVIAALAYLLSR
jgi:pSer/pThr/pTyr-binding forkhead associated (FHA) protein